MHCTAFEAQQKGPLQTQLFHEKKSLMNWCWPLKACTRKLPHLPSKISEEIKGIWMYFVIEKRWRILLPHFLDKKTFIFLVFFLIFSGKYYFFDDNSCLILVLLILILWQVFEFFILFFFCVILLWSIVVCLPRGCWMTRPRRSSDWVMASLACIAFPDT